MTVVPAYPYVLTQKTEGILLVRTYSYVKTTHPRIKNTEYCKSNKKAACNYNKTNKKHNRDIKNIQNLQKNRRDAN